MTLDEAKTLLNTCKREELQDHAFGDCEVYWMRGEETVAAGYFGGSSEGSIDIGIGVGRTRFSGAEADELRGCGARGRVERNDSTGPADFRQGECLPALTPEGVAEELARAPAGPCPRPCSECPDANHHWLEQCTDDAGEPVDPYYACKHCDAKAGCCDECLEPIFPVATAACPNCASAEGEFE